MPQPSYSERNNSTPKFLGKDVFVGALLGQGAFSTVKEAQRYNSSRQVSTYAIKQVRDDLESKNRSYAFSDLLNESKILSLLDHPNIIKMHGIGEVQDDSHVFLLLEKVSCTLDAKIEKWRETNSLVKAKYFNKVEKAELWNERMEVAKEFADALNYMHFADIIHRDLKLGNCGFDSKGRFKLFDFGLAVNLKEKTEIATDQYKLTGFTGTKRYMAPEVFNCKPYGKPADVYSFILLIWEIMSLSIAFEDENTETLKKNIHGERQFRPMIKYNWSDEFKNLVSDCWSNDPTQRPTTIQIMIALAECKI